MSKISLVLKNQALIHLVKAEARETQTSVKEVLTRVVRDYFSGQLEESYLLRIPSNRSKPKRRPKLDWDLEEGRTLENAG